jgi:hypothetical protein
MNNCTNRHNSIPIKNAIAVILAVAFLFTGAIVCPDQIDNTKLAPPSQLNSEDFRYSLTVGAICKYIERDGNLGNGSSLNDVLARLGADKNHSITVLPHEIIIEVPNERVAIRYLDPSKANIITPYSDISRLSTKIIGPSLLRQIIHRVNALPRGAAEVKFPAAYLDELRNRLLELEAAPRITDEIIDVLRQNLKDKEDQWFYSRLVRLTGIADIRQSGQAPRQYHGRVELAKNSGQLRRLINAVTPVYQFDKDGTLDKTNTELKTESARRLASLIIHGRKVGINTARSLQELNKGRDPDTGAPRELYANLREAVIAEIAKEGWAVNPETVADELLIDLFELFLDIGATRLTPRLGAQSQSDLVIDADFQRGCPEKLAEKLQYMLTEKGRDFHRTILSRIIQMAWKKLHAEGFFKNEYGPPALICHSMPIPKGHPLAEEFGTSVITRIAYRPFGEKAVPEKGTRAYRIISWARHVIRNHISEVLYEEMKLSGSTKNIEVIPVVTGRATIDITFNSMARKGRVVRLHDKEEKTQKDRAIEYQGKLGHVNILYFDDEALSGNGWPITRRLKENTILGVNLRVFAADPVPNTKINQWEFKGLTYIGGEERGVADHIDKELRRIETAAQRPAPSDPKKNIDHIDKNAAILKDMLGGKNSDVLLRIPVEVIESIGKDNVRAFLAAFQETSNGFVELYYMSGIGEVSENIYSKYGLQKKPLPAAFKRTRESTVTLFPAFKGEAIDQSAIVSRLGSIDVTPEDTILSPIGLQHDPAGLIRAAILGLKMMDIARQIKEKGIDITKNQSFKDKIQLDILEQLKNVCDIDDLKDFDLSPDDIIALAAGNINNVIAALKKLIRLLPIAPIDAEELKQMYEAVKAVITAA